MNNSDKKTEMLTVPVSPREKKQIEENAKKEELKVATYIRRKVLKEDGA